MKNLVLIVSFFLIGHLSIAQTGIINTAFSFQQINANQYSFTFHTFFSFGAGPTCPPFINHTFTIVGNTLQVKAFYDTTGAWPQVGCDRYDTVFYNNSIPSNINFIEMSTNAIGYNNTPPYTPSTIMYENIFVQTFNIASLSNISFNEESNKTIIFPNPAQEVFTVSSSLDFNKIVVINNLGQIVKKFDKNSSNNYEIKDVLNGIYYVIFYDFKNKKVGETKILKSN